jgi:hypothetical protein
MRFHNPQLHAVGISRFNLSTTAFLNTSSLRPMSPYIVRNHKCEGPQIYSIPNHQSEQLTSLINCWPVLPAVAGWFGTTTSPTSQATPTAAAAAGCCRVRPRAPATASTAPRAPTAAEATLLAPAPAPRSRCRFEARLFTSFMARRGTVQALFSWLFFRRIRKHTPNTHTRTRLHERSSSGHSSRG